LASAGGGIFTGGEPLSSEGRLTASDFSLIFLENWKEFFRWSNVDAVYLGVWRGLRAASRGLEIFVGWMERRALALVVVLAAAVLAGVRWFAPGASDWSYSRDVPLSGPISVPILLVSACAIAAVALLLTAIFSRANRSYIPQLYVPLIIFICLATVAGQLVADLWIRLGLLEFGALLTIVLVWQSARTLSAKLTYFTVVLISASSLVASNLLLERGQSEWAWALLVTSLCVKLAAIPLSFWLLSLADELPSVVLGLIIAVVDMAAFGEFLVASQSVPDFFLPHAFLLGAAAATSLLAALLMLTQRSLKRLLVLSTIEDIGFLMLGAASFTLLGLDGALIAATSHALAKALLFICLSGPEADGVLDGEHTGLATRYPVSAFGFLFGMLAMLGIPPTLGFIGRWRLYEAALQIHPLLLAVFILSSILALIAYVLALTRVWWGPAHPPAATPHPTCEPPIHEPFVLRAVIVLLTILLVAAGLWPDSLNVLLGGRP
jgi:multicomponent Na+:H+ antiporter subunit D